MQYRGVAASVGIDSSGTAGIADAQLKDCSPHSPFLGLPARGCQPLAAGFLLRLRQLRSAPLARARFKPARDL